MITLKTVSKIRLGIAVLPLFIMLNAGAANAQTAQLHQKNGSLKLKKIGNNQPKNIIFILTDDHRYDALGFLKSQTFMKTPNLDLMAKNGAYLPNAFVTTALCSPSRASILTGLYAHKHGVVDNNNPVKPELVFFAQYLQQAGYSTAMIGKWHMGGEKDDPQRGFDHWISFKGQGTYYPNANGLNIDGKHVPQKGYITDELTDYALSWLTSLKKDKPFMLYLSHKGVHDNFMPAERHAGVYNDHDFSPPKTMMPGTHKYAPMWVQNQRNSWHGVEFPYHSSLDIGVYYKRYAETLLGVDESVGRVMAYLKENNLLENTLVIYMGDNGFQFGEHGLIDKRNAYEASMRVPMLAYAPSIIKPGTVVEEVVANIDVAATLLEAAGLQAPEYMDGQSFFPLLKGETKPWRKGLLYEYYWERNFPQTPTMHALRGDRYKYIHYHGIWDTDELYDLQEDPLETTNLIHSKEHAEIIKQMNQELFANLKESSGMYIPLYPDKGGVSNLRYEFGSPSAEFPQSMKRTESVSKKTPAGQPKTNPEK